LTQANEKIGGYTVEKLKEKIHSYSFLVSGISVVLLIANFLSDYLGFKIDIPHLSEILTSLLGLAVLTGFVTKPEEEKEPEEAEKKDDDKRPNE
jgi:uncharacterized membrane protein